VLGPLMFQRLKRPSDCLRVVAFLAAVVAVFPLAPAGLGLTAASEVDSEQMPGESEESPGDTTLSLSERGVELQRRFRRGTICRPADSAVNQVRRLPINSKNRSSSECDCFSLPLRC
jgi:hypothetical protein